MNRNQYTTKQEYELAEAIVEKTLKHNPLTRESNQLLLIALMQEAGVELTTYQANVIRDEMFAFETYTRAARHLKKNPELAPSGKALQTSLKKEVETSNYFSSKKRASKKPKFITNCWVDEKGMGHIERTQLTI